jgi:predicted dehydrogenase
MTERQVGVGVIGCGLIAQRQHLPNLVRNPRVKVVAVADVNPARARGAADQFGVEHAYEDFHDLIARPDIDMVTVATWPQAHAAPVIAAAEAGKHVLCEKPIAMTVEEADAMVAACEKAGVKFTMGYQQRFGTELPLIKQLLDEGLVGKVMGMSTIGVGPSRHYTPWFMHKAEGGGGVLMDWGIYTAHNLIWLLGPVSSVYAYATTFRKEVVVTGRVSEMAGRDMLVSDVDVEDTAAITLQFASGAMGVWYAAWAVAAGHGGMSIDGSDGSIETHRGGGGVDLYTNRLEEPALVHGWRHIPTTEPPLAEVHYRKLAHLVDAVLDDKPLQFTGADGRDALELVLAIYRSAETGQRVDLPLPRIPVTKLQEEAAS